jgi:hypothetical protein
MKSESDFLANGCYSGKAWQIKTWQSCLSQVVNLAFIVIAQQCVQADLVVGRAKLRSPSESIFRFVGWFSHQAANAPRWAPRRKYRWLA